MVGMKPQAQKRAFIYGFVLANVIIFGYRFSSPEHRFGDFFSSWQNFLLFATIVLGVGFAGRMIAAWQFRSQ
jgi:hypothetical protein